MVTETDYTVDYAPLDPVIFHCTRFRGERGRLNETLNVVIGPQKIVDSMLRSVTNWSTANATITTMQEKLQKLDRATKRYGRVI